ncbi:hypothetical protein BH11ARM2_BH11ARM2_12800 [soil metagenome]
MHRTSSRLDICRGITLVEILAVLALIGVLMAILFPVLASAKQRSGTAEAIEQLRQIGLAGALYASENDSAPVFPSQIIGVLGVTEEMLSLRADPYPRGIGNQISQNQCISPTKYSTRYKRSFVGLRDLNITDYAAPLFRPEKNPGWLIDATPLKPLWPAPMALWTGKYRLLRLDGSVSLRHAPYVECDNDGKSEPCIPSELQFIDPDEDYYAWQSSHK